MSVKIMRINMIDKKVLGFRLIKKSPATKNINKCYGDTSVQMSWFTRKIKAFIEKLYPDFHVETKAQYNARMKANHDSEMEGSTITYAKKIHFYDEDVKKMETMTHEERMDYIIELKKAKRYIEDD